MSRLLLDEEHFVPRGEARAEFHQQRQDLRRRIRFHGIEHPTVGQSLGEGEIVLAHDIEVDDEAGPVTVVAVA
jgi:hypothetical protein